MNFKFNNYSRPTGKSRGGHDYFEWIVFMDEPNGTLEKVKSVEYRLHDTFSNRIRIVDNRESRFALKVKGWGTFWINIIIYLENDKEIYTKYHLDLNKKFEKSTKL